ncbi:hypothetical protein FPQ18DRAFT_309915 [Pyronema domesticum]|uniref:Similar to Next to BRCA1 gene 1 protein acc. no. Q5RC94 n=1 Tax=Pyronema omphalodes (strain CBS 100304) TaxID=1076935 RepID=U4L466_PYROM|nr:hypothetical protein FPQ18DRAFT_309915 [Pyronema domesticum]CCX07078.1 Similar to Next to BRCA1 gene 1 protein; acc. no. Q5RC94 [Pyronema omphalodes CBS 100304]
MSSPRPEQLITVKVLYDNETRRFKITLKDVGPTFFEPKMRELLAIPQGREVYFYRYSDSAGEWILLDPNSTPVYKQLFRAAKAKLKLRIKVTTPEGHDTTAPAVQNDSASTLSFPPNYSSLNVNSVRIPATQAAPSISPAELEGAVAAAVSSYCSGPEFNAQLRDTVREEVVKQKPEQSDLISLSEEVPEIPLEQTQPSQPETLLDGLISAAATENIFCDACKDYVDGFHYHCSICSGGDYDLCMTCVDRKNLHCPNRTHLLTSRDIVNGKAVVIKADIKAAANLHICNCCIGDFPEEECLICEDCDDYDLCVTCFRNGNHGHDPRHEFCRASILTRLSIDEKKMLSAGRNVQHGALCDHCDKTIYGVRHKCIDCPDWDYCGSCIWRAEGEHPGHRFVPVYSATDLVPAGICMPLAEVVHTGVYCDGVICAAGKQSSCIRGARYKCAICPDTDFCGTCEASPINTHNPTHPLIKFRTPIRNVLVTSTDDSNTVMGDVVTYQNMYKVEEPQAAPVATMNTATQVQTVAETKPTEEEIVEPTPIVEKTPITTEVVLPVREAVAAVEIPAEKEVVPTKPSYSAKFLGESIPDGTEVVVGQNFLKTWYMHNNGDVAWPVGCTVKFVGGDYMFLKENEAHLCPTYNSRQVAAGEVWSFSVELSAPWPAGGKYISYWRVVAPDGTLFGDNIWINITAVEGAAPVIETSVAEKQEDERSEVCSNESVIDVDSVKTESVKAESVKSEPEEELIASQASSQMVFPKLPVESPVQSVIEEVTVQADAPVPAPFSPLSEASHRTFALSDEDEDLEEIDISSIGSDEFQTDDEYDVLCASDEEFEECERIIPSGSEQRK